MRRRRIFGGLVAMLVVLGLAVIVWPDRTDRTDRILAVYADQLGLTEDEARQSRDDAVEIAEIYCSIEPDNLIESMAGTTTPVEDAIAYAEAACPDKVEAFREAVESENPAEADGDLRVVVDTELPAEEGRRLFGQIAAVPGIALVDGFEDGVILVLRPNVDADEVAEQVRALDGVLSVEPM